MPANVTINLPRIDRSDNTNLTKLARHDVDTFSYKADLSIDRAMAQLLQLRLAQINNCTYCLTLH